MADNTSEVDYLELNWGRENDFWVPDLYIRQLRDMKVLSLFQDMTSVRLYRNNTMRVSIGLVVCLFTIRVRLKLTKIPCLVGDFH